MITFKVLKCIHVYVYIEYYVKVLRVKKTKKRLKWKKKKRVKFINE